ncbi:guanylate cyclase 2D isoform X2 [Nasonia vitripennis]|uniref:Guanylate cyclase n=1 Tax=Nasonia vitripennis TaxID=7425 RepID=A0A7M7QKN8_NASVI|nr:guanylate cyclase 2D isoform X2 [Nasonia vitripennis]
MARCWLHQRWWWLLLVLFAGLSRLGYSQNPSATAAAAAGTTTTTTGPTPQAAITSPRIVVFLREQCDGELNSTELLRELQRGYASAIGMVSKAETCEVRSWGLEALVQALSQKTTKALVAQLDYNTCEVAAKLAHLWNKSLITWTCPQRTEEDRKLSSVVRLLPSPVVLGRALAEVFLHFRWKSVSVIGVDKAAWSSLDRSVIAGLRTIGIIPRHHAVLPHNANPRQIRAALRPLRAIPCRAIVVCLPIEGGLLSRTLVELDTMQESRIPSAVVLIVYPPNPQPFLPNNDGDDRYYDPSSPFSSRDTNDTSIPDELFFSEETPQPDIDERRFLPPRDLGRNSLDNLLAIVPFDQRYEVQRLLNGTTSYESPRTVDHLREALDVLTTTEDENNVNGSAEAGLNSFNNKMFTYGLLSYSAEASWQPVLTVTEQLEGLSVREILKSGFADEEIFDLLCDDQSDCPEKMSGIPLHTAHIVAIILGSLLFALTAIITAALIRRHLLKKRMSKGPYKIILTATDFVFPQIPDARRVDEGIEAMLCCWLQQLQEFGGPEVEKPDLLQGSVGSLRPHLQASNGNLARHIFNDPRARYNGDLVQLKQLPVQGAFELKGKAMDVLVTIHGLRHENLNPLIGCLTEPSRPCIVYEYCSRGSLEDVLVQDEIKLDWSFRLSLLTDLVRGMKYLHSTPIRVHGYLTSRNCVIDARWVLKVTDYGLPAFYEAQNVQPPERTARDLLWTAPELLRHAGLQKRGSQPGDVYSFGIVMQEVVVRGEPFCMLALSPEDIIEKVKKPPPLIRPSVSKGAAPPEAINIMRQCWAENADMRPDFNAVHDLFKKLNHGRKVNFVDTMFQMLEKYSNNLEELIRERTEQLDMEKKKTEQLLNRMLPSSVAEKLKLGMPVDPEEFAEVTIYFSDIVGFTTISAYSTPFQVVDLLNDLYTCFDATINAYNVYKVETIGDAYMVVGGCPVRIPDHASQIATMALDLLHQSGKFKLRHLPNTQLRLRIGLHTGPCCAGVVGLTMPRYCLFGDTVNTASRMESTGAPWRIHLSQATRDRLTQVGGYVIEYRGRTDIKGKGKMPTYWLLGKQDFDKELPVPPPLGEDHGIEDILILETLQTSEQQQQQQQPQQQPSDSTSSLIAHLTGQLPTLNSTEDDSSAECSVAVSLPAVATTSRESHASPAKFAHSEQSSIDKGTGLKRVAVSVHEDRAAVLGQSFSMRSVGPSDTIDVAFCRDGTRSTPDYASATVTKSTSGDNPMTLGESASCLSERSEGTPVSATEVAAALLGASSTSINSVSSSVFRGRPRRVGVIDEDDLSTPYNHYRCLSPNEHSYAGKTSFEPSIAEKSLHARRTLGRSRIKSLDIESSIAAGRAGGSCRLLRRQFSLDRADEPTGASSSGAASSSEQQVPLQHRPPPRLFKQNSAGAANDLERIEEVPSTPQASAGQAYRHSASVSLSVESLTLR